jgi:SPP1 gp7 family putative phage head morphogenesis protein
MSVSPSTLSRNYHHDVRNMDKKTLRVVLAAYRDVEPVIVAEFERLQARVAELEEAGQPVDQATLVQLDEYRRLVETIRATISHYARAVDRIVQARTPEALSLAAEHAREAGLELMFDPHHPEAFISMVATLDPESPVVEMLRRRASEQFAESEAERAVQAARRALLTAVAAGWNPRTAAKLLREALATTAYRAQRIARTEMLRAYRLGTLEIYRQSGVVKKWRWVAALSPRTCGVCLSYHGRVFDAESVIFDHPNGRCVTVPVTDESIIDTPQDTLPDAWLWFWNQPFEVRDKMLGLAWHEALRRGEIRYDHLSWVKFTPYGAMVIPYKLKSATPTPVRTLVQWGRERNALPPEQKRVLQMADAIAGYLERVIRLPVVRRRDGLNGLGWNGTIVWDEGHYIAAFNPRFFSILVSKKHFKPDEPFAVHTIVHELLHAGSATGKSGFWGNEMAFEEAWAEAYARHITRRMARDVPAFRDLDLRELEFKWELHPYNGLAQTIEEARKLVGMEPDVFYHQLAPAPGQNRWTLIQDWISEKYRGQYRERKLRELQKLKDRLIVEFQVVQILGGGV